MAKKTSIFLLVSSFLGMAVEGCKKNDEAIKAVQEGGIGEPPPISDAQRIGDSALSVFNRQLKSLDDKIQAGKSRATRTGKGENRTLLKGLQIIESRRKKIVDDAIDLEKRPETASPSDLSRLGRDLELLSRDVDRLLIGSNRTE